jgi:tetratricopeptide (TPR) repeat protein
MSDNVSGTISHVPRLNPLKEQQQLLATETLEELFDSKRLTEESYQELVELVQTNRYSEAQKLLSESVSQKDRSVKKSGLTFLLRFLEGLELLEVGKNLEALELFDAVLAENESYVDAWNNRGNSLHNLGRYEEAIASYDRSISIKPDRDEAWSNRGVSLGDLGRYEEAISSYDRAISIKPDRDEAWNNRGVSLGDLGRYEEAISSCDRAISINPDNHQAIHNKGFAYFKWGKYVQSIDCYNQAISIESDRYNSWHDKGLVQFVMGNYEDALNSWQQTFQIIRQLTPRPNDLAGLIQEFLEQLIPRLSLLINPLLPSEAKVSTPPPISISPPPSLKRSTPPSTNSSPPSFNPSTPPPSTNPSMPPSLPWLPELIDFSPPPFIYSSTFLTQLITIYKETQVLPELSTALIATLPQILAPNISDRNADEWLALWQNLLGTEPALEMPLRLMNVAISYKKQPALQKRLWLGLAKEERSILNGALGLEES